MRVKKGSPIAVCDWAFFVGVCEVSFEMWFIL